MAGHPPVRKRTKPPQSTGTWECASPRTMYDTIQMNSTARTLPDIRMPTPRFTTMTGLGGGGHTAHDVNQQMNCFNQDREWQESRLASFAGQWTTRKYEAGVNTGLSGHPPSHLHHQCHQHHYHYQRGQGECKHNNLLSHTHSNHQHLERSCLPVLCPGAVLPAQTGD